MTVRFREDFTYATQRLFIGTAVSSYRVPAEEAWQGPLTRDVVHGSRDRRLELA